jgi:hypothetical protein
MDVDISAATPSLAEAMEFSSGKIDIDVWPQDVQADVFDLWATNLFLTLATRLDPSSASRINCGVIRFRMQDGVLTHDQILLDTTRVRVAGEGSVDFKTEAIRLKMEPLPKRAEFFSLGTPIVVDGTFDDFSIGASAGDVAGTAVRLATSLLWVPLKKLFGRAVPDNGSDVCGDPGRFVSSVEAVAAADQQTDPSPPAQPAEQAANLPQAQENKAVQQANSPAEKTGADPAPVSEAPKPPNAHRAEPADVSGGFPVVRLEPKEPAGVDDANSVGQVTEEPVTEASGASRSAQPRWRHGDDDDPYIF